MRDLIEAAGNGLRQRIGSSSLGGGRGLGGGRALAHSGWCVHWCFP